MSNIYGNHNMTQRGMIFLLNKSIVNIRLETTVSSFTHRENMI